MGGYTRWLFWDFFGGQQGVDVGGFIHVHSCADATDVDDFGL